MQQKNNDDLLNRFKSTTEKDLEQVVTSVDGLDSKSYEDANRASDHNLFKSWIKLKSFLHRIAEWSILVSTIIFFILLIRFIWDIVQNQEETKMLLKEIWNAVLISLATLFVQYAVSKKNNLFVISR